MSYVVWINLKNCDGTLTWNETELLFHITILENTKILRKAG